MSGQTLSPRESAVLAAVERRLSNPEIAAELFISVRTVDSDIAILKLKLKTRPTDFENEITRVGAEA